MADDPAPDAAPPPPDRPASIRPRPAPDDRAARRAAALRANLHRRKAQARARAALPDADGAGPVAPPETTG